MQIGQVRLISSGPFAGCQSLPLENYGTLIVRVKSLNVLLILDLIVMKILGEKNIGIISFATSLLKLKTGRMSKNIA